MKPLPEDIARIEEIMADYPPLAFAKHPDLVAKFVDLVTAARRDHVVKGKPCKHGHHVGRTKDGHCLECQRIRGLTRYYEDPAYRAKLRTSVDKSQANARLVRQIFGSSP